MTDRKSHQALESELRKLEARVAELIAVTGRLREENRSLRDSQEQLATERANLLARNEQVRIRVEAMIHRLRALEQNA
jgi:cell division protein ZapB